MSIRHHCSTAEKMIGSRTSVGGCEKIPDASVSKIQVFERERAVRSCGARVRERWRQRMENL